MEQFEAVKDKEREQLEELEVAKKNVKAATEAFNDVRQKRFDSFMEAFELISGSIDRIFKV